MQEQGRHLFDSSREIGFTKNSREVRFSKGHGSSTFSQSGKRVAILIKVEFGDTSFAFSRGAEETATVKKRKIGPRRRIFIVASLAAVVVRRKKQVEEVTK